MKQDDLDKFQRRTGVGEDDLELLSRVPLFSGLPREATISLLADSSVRRYPRNTMLFLQGDPATRFFAVFDGWVKLFRQTPDGHETVIGVFTRGETFAEAAIFTTGIFPVNATAAEDARLLVIPAPGFLRQLGENSDLSRNMLGAMSRRLHRLVQLVEQLTVQSAAQRLAAFLVQLAPAEEGSTVVHLPLDKSLVAARLGMQPETLSRSFAKLRQHGIVTHEKDVTIPDLAALKEISEGGQG
jgi:CRP-like cAMP-binding protein